MTFFRVRTHHADIMIKPDGVQRGLVGEIIKRFEQKGYKLVAMKLTAPGKEHMEKHYADLSSKGFFAGLIKYMTSGPVCAMVSTPAKYNTILFFMLCTHTVSYTALVIFS